MSEVKLELEIDCCQSCPFYFEDHSAFSGVLSSCSAGDYLGDSSGNPKYDGGFTFLAEDCPLPRVEITAKS